MYFITENLLKHVTDPENMSIIYNILHCFVPQKNVGNTLAVVYISR
jgi:hypothetical protein